MTVFFIITILLLLILLIRIGITAEYSCDGFKLDLNIAFLKIRLFPCLSNKAVDKKKNDKNKINTASRMKKGGLLPDLWGIIELASKTLGRMRKKILVNHMILYYTAGDEDPSDAAMSCGQAMVGINAIYPALTNIFKIKKAEFYTDTNFTSEHPVIYLSLKLSLSIFDVLYIASAFVIDYFRVRKAKRIIANKNNEHERKVDSNG